MNKCFDPHNNKERFEKWKEDSIRGIEGINKKNSSVILQYINDMEQGLNVSRKSVKGSRSCARLNTLRTRMTFLAKTLESRKINDITKVSSKQIHELFNDMRTGKLKKQDGGIYQSVGDYVKVFRAFFNWWRKVNRMKGIEIKDITEDLDSKIDKPTFVYFTYEELQKILPYFSQDEQTILLFMFDTGIRSPTELMNVKYSDLIDNVEVNIRPETSKTFGRRIKLMLCKDALREFVKREHKPDEFLFQFSPPSFNQKLKRVGKEILGKEGLTMYDFRHSSACYYLQRYKDEKSMKYRFGWKKSEMIFYYTEFLGMEDNITPEDMIINIDKDKLQQQIEELAKRVIELEQEKQTGFENSTKQMYEKEFKKLEIFAKKKLKDALKQRNLIVKG